jgi:hypothetical protein
MKIKNELEVLFCEKCGSSLLDTFIHLKFDKHTGEELFKVRSVCPNYKKFNWHDNYIRGYNKIGYDDMYFIPYIYLSNGKIAG